MKNKNNLNKNLIRIFIGIPIDNNFFKKLVKKIKSINCKNESLINYRWTEPHNAHITLIFLGSISNELMPSLFELVNNVSQGTRAFDFNVEKITGLPQHSNKLIAAYISHSTELIELQQKIQESLARYATKHDNHAYLPHITLARPKGKNTIEKVQPVSCESMTSKARELVVYQSIPSESGSQYIPLVRCPLR